MNSSPQIPKQRNYLRWLFAYKTEPYQMGGYWFGGKASGKWVGTGTRCGIDCRGLVGNGARWAGYNWSLWPPPYTGVLYSGDSVTTETFPPSDPFGPGDILCYYRLKPKGGHEGHVVSVYALRTVADRTKVDIIEAAGGNPLANLGSNYDPPHGSVVRVHNNTDLVWDWLTQPSASYPYKKFRLVAR